MFLDNTLSTTIASIIVPLLNASCAEPDVKASIDIDNIMIILEAKKSVIKALIALNCILFNSNVVPEVIFFYNVKNQHQLQIPIQPKHIFWNLPTYMS